MSNDPNRSPISKRLREAFSNYQHPCNPRALCLSMLEEMRDDTHDTDWEVLCYCSMWIAYLIAKNQKHEEWLGDFKTEFNDLGEKLPIFDPALTHLGIGGPLLESLMKEEKNAANECTQNI